MAETDLEYSSNVKPRRVTRACLPVSNPRRATELGHIQRIDKNEVPS